MFAHPHRANTAVISPIASAIGLTMAIMFIKISMPPIIAATGSAARPAPAWIPTAPGAWMAE